MTIHPRATATTAALALAVWTALCGFGIGGEEGGEALPPPVDPAPPTEDLKAESLEEYRARRAKLENGPAPYLFVVTDPAGGKTAHVQGVPIYHTRALYPMHPRLREVLDAADYIVTSQSEPDEEDDDGNGKGEDLGAANWMSMMFNMPEFFVKAMAELVPADAFLPEGERLADRLDPEHRERWLALRGEFMDGVRKDDDELFRRVAETILGFVESLKPLAAAAIVETMMELQGHSSDEEVMSLENRLAGEARARGIRTGQRDVFFRYPGEFEAMYRDLDGRLDPPARSAAPLRVWERIRALFSSENDATNPFLVLCRREYDAWFNNDRGYLPPDPEWTDWMRTRVNSEFKRRIFAPAYARLLKRAMARHDAALMAVPMEYLADGPANFAEALAAEGLEIRPAGEDPE